MESVMMLVEPRWLYLKRNKETLSTFTSLPPTESQTEFEDLSAVVVIFQLELE